MRVRLGLCSGVIAAFLWIVADMLLVGFIPRPETHTLFSRDLSAQLDGELALLMLDASPQRLLWGVYLATFSVAFYILALHGVWHLLASGRWRIVFVFLLLLGYALSPLGHAGFAYVGLQAQGMLLIPPEFLKSSIANFNLFVQLLYAHWAASVGASALGWIGVGILTLVGKTQLPRWAIFFNPLPVALVIMLVCSLFETSLVAVLIGCASFNLAQWIFFFTALLFQSGEKPKGKT